MLVFAVVIKNNLNKMENVSTTVPLLNQFILTY